MELSFSNPIKILEYLTSEEADYQELADFAKDFSMHISELHTNKEGRKFQAITQIILECYKLIHGFKYTQWISENKLEYELKQGEQPIVFKRINSQGEICEYKIANIDQIDFDKELKHADEFEVLKPKTENNKEENEEFQKVLTLLLNGENVFLTGFAGTGKSYILSKLKEKFKKKLTITSTTGIAAVNIKGQTLHSWAGVGLCRNPVHKTVEKIKTRVSTYKQILNCKILAIDEISMLNIETFEYVDEVLKNIRDSREPFGGIQVLLIGDFYQLPPVEKEDSIEKHFCFESPIWEDMKLKNVVLRENYRQSEEKFIHALSDMRTNCLTEEDVELLKTRETNLDTFETDLLHIFSTNEEANRYNLAKFNMINEPVKIFKAEDGVYRGNKPVYEGFTENENYVMEIFGRNCRADKELPLKKGAKVMLLVNTDFNRGLINGSCGIIQEFNENSITIKFDNGVVAPIGKHKFEYYYHDRIAAERTQYPLRLAYGITIHKSQGMTLDELVVDCSRIFERGQAYVAMSRVRKLNGMYLKSFGPEKVMVDEKVARFYQSLQEVGSVKPINGVLFDFDENGTPRTSNDDVRKLVKDCVKEFSGIYGRSGIANILYGSKSIIDNEFHATAVNSNFYGAVSGWRKKELSSFIDNMVNEGIFDTQGSCFGPPLLCFKEDK